MVKQNDVSKFTGLFELNVFLSIIWKVKNYLKIILTLFKGLNMSCWRTFWWTNEDTINLSNTVTSIWIETSSVRSVEKEKEIEKYCMVTDLEIN